MDISELADRYQTMTRAYERGAQDGHKNFPTPEEKNLSPTESEIVQIAQDDLNRTSNDCKTKLDSAWEKVRVLRSDLATDRLFTIETFKTRCDLKFNDVERELARLFEKFLDRQRDYRFFKTVNRLDRDAELPATGFDIFSILAFLAAFESALNAYFFMDATPYGMVGGFLTAATISLLNIALGFLLGVLPWRYLQHKNKLHRIWAFPLLCCGLILVILLNFGVGHYRDLVSANKDALIPEILQPMLTSTFVLETLQSYALTGLGMVIAALSARKGYSMFDSYPGFGRQYEAMEIAKDEYEQKISQIQKDFNDVAENYLHELNSSFSKVNKATQESLLKIEEALSQYKNYEVEISGIEDACNSAINEYRKSNRQVRDDRCPPPKYFSAAVQLHKTLHDGTIELLEKQKDELSASSARLKDSVEKIIKQIPSIERQLLSEQALSDRLNKVRQVAQKAHDEKNREATSNLAAAA